MTKASSNSNLTLGIRKAREHKEKFLQVDISIWNNLSPHALKTYGQLRQLVDFREEHDETEITVEALAIKTGISVRKTYYVLNELEKEHFLIQRLNNHHWRYGVTNSYDIAQTYGFFKPVENITQPSEPPPTVQTLTTTAQYAVPTAPNAVPTAQYAVPYNEVRSSLDPIHMCGEDEPPTQHTIKKLKKEKAEQNALKDEGINSLFKEKFSGYNVTIDEMFASCQEHYEQKSLWATKEKFLKWVKREKIENYSKSGAKTKTAPANETDAERQERQFFTYEIMKEKEKDGAYVSTELQKYPEMREKYSKYA